MRCQGRGEGAWWQGQRSEVSVDLWRSKSVMETSAEARAPALCPPRSNGPPRGWQTGNMCVWGFRHPSEDKDPLAESAERWQRSQTGQSQPVCCVWPKGSHPWVNVSQHLKLRRFLLKPRYSSFSSQARSPSRR